MKIKIIELQYRDIRYDDDIDRESYIWQTNNVSGIKENQQQSVHICSRGQFFTTSYFSCHRVNGRYSPANYRRNDVAVFRRALQSRADSGSRGPPADIQKTEPLEQQLISAAIFAIQFRNILIKSALQNIRCHHAVGALHIKFMIRQRLKDHRLICRLVQPCCGIS